MELTKEHLKLAETDINTLVKIHSGYWNESRYQILKKFCEGAQKILSVGCGPREPTITGATHALDISPLSEKYLRDLGWKGLFSIGSCTSLPFKRKSFDIVVCSEVIEHLPTIADVIQTFKEVSRVGKKWLITTPNSAVDNPRYQNPSHRQFFTLETIKKIIPVENKIYANDKHLYIENI